MLAGCNLSEKQPSVLVIAVDSLSYDAILCTESENYKGFKTVCDEMTRFTHAYTTSILAEPALASLLTGLYPFDHKARHNASVLSAQNKLSSEVAIEKSYRTSFFSGGPPIFRKSGLHQGFEIFDDNININIDHYYRPVNDTFNLFTGWLKNEVLKDPFFSFIYVPDLQFKNLKTVDNKGIERERAYSGQIMELDESLDFLIKNLKKMDRWNSSWIFIVGLNGQAGYSRANEIEGTNLYPEKTRVTLFVKKPEKEKDKTNSWVMDAPVTVADVGKTLFDILEYPAQESILKELKIISLKPKIETLKKDEDEKRFILMESAWPSWREVGKVRYALQIDNYLITYDQKTKVYNTVVDRNQQYTLDQSTINNNSLLKDGIELLRSIDAHPWAGVPYTEIERYQFAPSFWNKNELTPEEFLDLEKIEKIDIKMQSWVVEYLYKHNKWLQLLHLFGTNIKEEHPNPLTVYHLLAREKLDLPPIKIEDTGETQCLLYLATENKPTYEPLCLNKLFMALIHWKNYVGTAKENLYKEIFVKNYKYYMIDKEIQKLNYSLGYIWDTRDNLLNETKYSDDIDIDAVLDLKVFKKFKEANRVAQENKSSL